MTAKSTLSAELEAWMQDKEGENQEFKEAKSRFDFEELSKSCCALANEGGGRIILGVSDRRPRRVVGSPRSQGSVHLVGKSKGGRWFPGPESEASGDATG